MAQKGEGAGRWPGPFEKLSKRRTIAAYRPLPVVWGLAGCFINRRSRLSTEISKKPTYISSQLCSDQKTSFCGAEFHLFADELSYDPIVLIVLPAGILIGSFSS